MNRINALLLIGSGLSFSIHSHAQPFNNEELLKNDEQIFNTTSLYENDKPNIVFIFADQLRADALSCYGDPNIKTPNIDQLATDGVLFNHAISTFPQCSPYRAQLLTGKLPFHNGVIGNNRILNAGQETFGTYVLSEGYRTGWIGKWDVWPRSGVLVPKEARPGFEEYFMSYNCAHHTHMDGYYFDTDGNKICFPGDQHSSPYEATVQTDLAVDFINRQASEEEPFCLFVSWGPPHEPRDLIPEEKKVTDPHKLVLRDNVHERDMVDEMLAFDPGYEYRPFRAPLEQRTKSRRPRDRQQLDSEDYIRTDLALYYDNIIALDLELGRIIKAIEINGIRENTIVVFTSDHGDMLGSHRMGHKQMPHEESIRIPFILSYPGKVKSGQVTDALFAPIDIIPTLFNLAGLKVPSVDGRDMSLAAFFDGSYQQEGLLIGSILTGGNPLYSNNIRPWRGVRTERYTYAKFLEPEEKDWLLYDNIADPYQVQNLINDEDYSSIKGHLNELTDRLRIDAGEQLEPDLNRNQINSIHNNNYQKEQKLLYFPEGKELNVISRDIADGMLCK